MRLRWIAVTACAGLLCACGGTVSVGSEDAGAPDAARSSFAPSPNGGGSNSGAGGGGSSVTPPSVGPTPTGPNGSGGTPPNGGFGGDDGGAMLDEGGIGPSGSVCYGDPTGCQCQASYKGHDEVLVCAATSGRCTCLLDGAVTQTFASGSGGDAGDAGSSICTDLSGIEAAFTSVCGFSL